MHTIQTPCQPSRLTGRAASFHHFIFCAAVMLAVGLPLGLRAADVTWDGGPAGTDTNWLVGANWGTDAVPGPTDNAIVDSVGTATTIRINMDAVGGLQQVGAFTMGAGRAAGLNLRNYPTSTNGTLQFNGAGGVLLSNATALHLQVNSISGVLDMRLGGSGDIYVAQNGIITLWTTIGETGGARGFTKTGDGTLYLRNGSPNSFTGNITNTAGPTDLGAIKVDNLGDFGTGTLYLTGGDISCGADRASGVPLANPVVMTADALVFNDAGLANTSRTIPFSGPFSGSAGTLTIANLTVVLNQTFVVRMSGAFTFGRPIVVGSAFDTVGSFAVLELYNSATNGTLTLSGDISGVGSIRRSGATSSAGGTTVLTGNNTYAGGTVINYGTLLANSATALGTGAVTVTNQGVLGGTATISGATIVSTGGSVAPGATASSLGNLNIDTLTLGTAGQMLVQIGAATGTPGVNWDLITCAGSWTDAASLVSPVVIKLDTLGVAPTGWNPAISRTWKIIQSTSAVGFDAAHFSIDATAFVGASGVFSLLSVSGELFLEYTPGTDVVINVASGSVNQGSTSPTPYPLLSGNINVLKIGNGEVVFTNALNDYPGTTKILAGTLSIPVDALNGSGALGAASSPVELGNTTGTSNATFNISVANVTMGRNLLVHSGSTGIKTISTTIGSGAATNSGTVTLDDSVTFDAAAGGTLMVSGPLSGVGGITKSGAGKVVTTNVNTFTGKTKILGGILAIDAAGRLGALPGSLVADQVTLDGGTLEFTVGTASSGANRGFSLGSGNGTFDVQSGNLIINGPVSGLGSLTKTGASRLDLNNAANTWAGDTVLAQGDLQLDGDASLGAGTLRLQGGNFAISATRSTTTGFISNAIEMTGNTAIFTTGGANNFSRIAVFSGSTITTSGGMLTITNGASTNNNNIFEVRLVGAGFNFTQPIVLDNGIGLGNAAQLYLGSSNSTPAQTFSGVISGNGRVRRSAAVVSDAGSTVVTAANTYSGGSTVNAGTLLVNNTTGSGTGTGAVTVTSPGVLGGTGTIAGAVSGTGTIAPGASAGTITLGGGLDLSTGGTYLWELAANSTSNPGVNYDVISLTGGNLALGGSSTLQLSFTGSATLPDTGNPFWQTAHTWQITALSGGAANPGATKFASIANGTFAAGSFTNYTDGSGNIILEYVPAASATPPNITAASQSGDGNFSLTFGGTSGFGYSVRASTNVTLPRASWTVLGTGTFGASPVTFNDLNATNFPQRFYLISIP